MSKEIKKDRLRTNIQTVTSEFVGAEEDDEAIQAQLAQIDKVKLDIKLNEFDNVLLQVCPFKSKRERVRLSALEFKLRFLFATSLNIINCKALLIWEAVS